MAVTNFIDVSNLNYYGKEANEIFSKMLYSLPLASQGIRLMDNVKGKQKLYTGEIGDVWQQYSCPFTPSGEASLKEDFIEPARIKVNLENCYDAFDQTYFVEQTRIALDGGIPQTFFDWFFNDQLLKKMEKEYQMIFWQGDTDYDGETKKFLAVTDGIEKKLLEEAALINGSAFTSANILAQVKAAVEKALDNAADNEVEIDDEWKIYMNRNDIRVLKAALGDNSPLTVQIWSNFTKEGDKVYAYGFEIVPTEQSKNTIIVGPGRNMVLGYDTFDSHTQYKLIDLRETTGDNAFRVLALSNIAVGLVLGEIFVYSAPGAGA